MAANAQRKWTDYHLWRLRPPDKKENFLKTKQQIWVRNGFSEQHSSAKTTQRPYFQLLLSIIFLFVLPSVCLASNCPSYCDCRWKGGKENVECRSAALIEVPQNLDSGTQVLDLGENNLQQLPKDTFLDSNLLNLQRIYMPNCNIEQIDQEAFRKLSNLVELDLTDNLLAFIPSLAFREIPSLRKLVMCNNPVSKLKNDALIHLISLTYLDLSGCKISEVEPRAFTGLAKLTHLKLDRNALTFVHHQALVPLVALHSLDLQYNPWRCDCKMRPTRQWIQRHNIPSHATPICTYPAKLANQPWDRLMLDDFACAPMIHLPEVEVTVKEGDNVTLFCEVSGNPEPAVHWVYAGRQIGNMTARRDSQTQIYVIAEEGLTEKATNLTITYLELRETGVYQCVAENRADRVVANISVRVTSLSKIPDLINGLSNDVGFSMGDLVGVVVVSVAFFVLLVILMCLIIVRCKKPKSDKKRIVIKAHVNDLNHCGYANNVGNHKNHIAADAESCDMTSLGPNPIKKPPRFYQVLPTTDIDEIGNLVPNNSEKLWSNEYVFLQDLRSKSPDLPPVPLPPICLDTSLERQSCSSRGASDETSLILRTPKDADKRRPLMNNINSCIYSDILNLESAEGGGKKFGSIDRLNTVGKPDVVSDDFRCATLPLTKLKPATTVGESNATTSSSGTTSSNKSIQSVITDRTPLAWCNVSVMKIPRIQPTGVPAGGNLTNLNAAGLIGNSHPNAVNKVVVFKEENGGVVNRNATNV